MAMYSPYGTGTPDVSGVVSCPAETERGPVSWVYSAWLMGMKIPSNWSFDAWPGAW